MLVRSKVAFSSVLVHPVKLCGEDWWSQTNILHTFFTAMTCHVYRWLQRLKATAHLTTAMSSCFTYHWLQQMKEAIHLSLWNAPAAVLTSTM